MTSSLLGRVVIRIVPPFVVVCLYRFAIAHRLGGLNIVILSVLSIFNILIARCVRRRGARAGSMSARSSSAPTDGVASVKAGAGQNVRVRGVDAALVGVVPDRCCGDG